MPLVLLLLFLGLPLLELAVLIKVGTEIGVLWTIGLLIAVSVIGAALAKREGLAAWRRFQQSLARGETPTSEIADGFLILLGAALLLTPGFITDAFGLVLLLPPSRMVVKKSMRRAGGWLFLRRFRPFRA